MKKPLLLFISCLLLAGCSLQNWEQTSNGVVIDIRGKTGRDTRKVKLEVITNRIIHVTLLPSPLFQAKKA